MTFSFLFKTGRDFPENVAKIIVFYSRYWDPRIHPRIPRNPPESPESPESPWIPGIPGIPGSGPRRAGQALGSTRAGGKDDGSLHKLPQIT